jgi:hypothetical protein
MMFSCFVTPSKIESHFVQQVVGQNLLYEYKIWESPTPESYLHVQGDE